MIHFEPNRAFAVSRVLGMKHAHDSRFFRIDTFKDAPPTMQCFQCMNPFYWNPSFTIPVPGQIETACSVESIWQGLKIIDGQTNFQMFKEQPYKRPSEVERLSSRYRYQSSIFLFGEDAIDLLTARYMIYLPSYTYLLSRLVPQALWDRIRRAMVDGKVVLFYDWDSNFDIENVTQPFSHSAILADWVNGDIERTMLSRSRQFSQERSLAVIYENS